MLNRDLNASALAAEFARRRRIQIQNVLEAPAAEQIADVLRTKTKWMLAFNRGPQSVTMSQEEIAGLGRAGVAGLMQECLKNAETGFQYVYSSYPIVDAIVNRRDLGHPLHGVLEAINAPAFRQFIERVTGVSGLIKADGQATLYSRGNFLTFHNDFDDRNKRRIAYVLGFTRKWRSDWGGLLEFYDAHGNVDLGLVPRFNVLSLFAVPANHAVTYVTPFASEGRYSITGWFSVA
jgi:Rps23 Pro-64 3,4-dihydroxylase Tpa1-like proline 4-hydroxylase